MAIDFNVHDLSVVLGITVEAVQKRGKRECWAFRTETCRGGTRRMYIFDSLPAYLKTAIKIRNQGAAHTIIKKGKRHCRHNGKHVYSHTHNKVFYVSLRSKGCPVCNGPKPLAKEASHG